MSEARQSNERKLDTVFTENVSVVFGNAGPVQFNLHCQFTPDTIEVQCAMALYDGDLQPIDVPAADGNLVASNLFSVTSDLPVNSPVLCVCNSTNTYNPVSRYSNVGRSSFNGTYHIDCQNVSSGLHGIPQQITDGVVVLTFRFTRYP